MSRIVTTKVGRFRSVTNGVKKEWLWKSPKGIWHHLNASQMRGEKSVMCNGYHETHEFAKELVLEIQVRELLGENPYEEDTYEPKPNKNSLAWKQAEKLINDEMDQPSEFGDSQSS